MKGILHNQYKILKNLYTKKTLCIHNLEKITKNRITLTTFYIHDLLITKLYAYWTFVLAQFKHCTLTYKPFVLIFTFYIKRITACTFQNIVLLDKKLCNSKLCTMNICNYVLPDCNICTSRCKNLRLTFKALQMALDSRILKAFDSYMENFYRTPSFECTYLKT